MSDTKDTRFQPGQSGNPEGRRRGTGWVPAAREELKKAWDGERPDGRDGIRHKVIEMAKEGDLAAIRIVAERVAPPLKAAEPPVALEMQGETITEKAYSVLTALGDGQLAPGQAAQLISALGALAQVQKVDELAKRLEALEGKVK